MEPRSMRSAILPLDRISPGTFGLSSIADPPLRGRVLASHAVNCDNPEACLHEVSRPLLLRTGWSPIHLAIRSLEPIRLGRRIGRNTPRFESRWLPNGLPSQRLQIKSPRFVSESRADVVAPTG